jgi:DNA invertase Pin-like site-specific DNA recombinase
MAQPAVRSRSESIVVRALLYRRVSTEEQAQDGESLLVQRAGTRRYAARQGWMIANEFEDVLSGTRSDRPGYGALLEEARKRHRLGQRVVIVVNTLDRFGRSLLERARCAEELRLLRVPIHSVLEGGALPDLVADILAVVAEEESRRHSTRAVESVKFMTERGWHPPGRGPWGYRWRPATPGERADGAPVSVLELDPVQAPVAREAWERLAAGASVRSIAQWIWTLGSEVLGGRGMAVCTLAAIFHAPVYVGRPEHGDPDVLARPRGRWPALVRDATWTAATRRWTGPELRPRSPREPRPRLLLTGYLRCPRCGDRMWGKWVRRPSPRYVCSRSTEGAIAGRECSASVSAGPYDSIVRGELGRMMDSARSHSSTLQRRWQEQATGIAADPGRINELEKLVEIATSRRSDAAVKFVDGEIDRRAYQMVRSSVETELAQIERELQHQRDEDTTKLPAWRNLAQDLVEWDRALDAEEIVGMRLSLQGLLVSAVPASSADGHCELRFTWTELGAALRRLLDLDAGGTDGHASMAGQHDSLMAPSSPPDWTLASPRPRWSGPSEKPRRARSREASRVGKV